MQTKYFKYIREIAHCGSITKAAEQLYISQQALSKILDHVEDELGFKIFERTNKGITATKNGEKFLVDIERIMEIMHEWEQVHEETYKMKILLQFVLSDLILDEAFCQAVNASGNIELQWETMPPPEIVKRMKTGEQSWGILIASPQTDIYPKLMKASSSKMKVEVIGQPEITKMQILLRCEDALAKKDSISLVDLRQKTFVINKGILVTETPQKLSQCTEQETTILPFTVNAVDYIARHDDTFTCLPGFIAYNNSHVKNGNVVIRPLEESLDEELRCYLLYHAENTKQQQTIIKNMKTFFETIAINI